jgi:hypothetical protein
LKFNIAKLNEDVEVFKVLPYQLMAECTFEWLDRYRRLSKDYEELAELTLHIYDLLIIISSIDHLPSICPLTK